MNRKELNGVFIALRRLQNIPGEEFVKACWPRHKAEMKAHLIRKFSQAGDNLVTFWHMLDLEHQQAMTNYITSLSDQLTSITE